jgi:hypothetical protein
VAKKRPFKLHQWQSEDVYVGKISGRLHGLGANIGCIQAGWIG